MPENHDLSYVIQTLPIQSPLPENLVNRSILDKLSVLRILIAKVHKEIYERRSLESIILDSLNQNLMDLHTKQFAHAQITRYQLRPISPLEAQCTDIEIAKTKEQQQSFQDQSKLQQELRQLLREYFEMFQNHTLFSR
jgi:hypothetical protein